ncbi:DUF3108 domain-containing protein [Microbaculum marinum]|uniref:DUF3108 domain-containing protein n=1 Tax=Microbaculum marinum TaxID=1764581 RepID=A0AAW9RN81_9HYPH
MKAVASVFGPIRKVACSLMVTGIVLAAPVLPVQPASAGDYNFQAKYRVSLAGVPIGEANFMGNFDGRRYRLDGYGKLTGIAGVLYEYTASASSAGELYSGRIVPNAFSVNASDGEETSTVRMTMGSSGVRRLKITPEPTPYWLNHPNRVKVTDAHTRGTLDPISALIVAGGSSGAEMDKHACERTVPIFNGRERFDVELRYRRIQPVSDSAVPGGQVLVCGAHYRPVAGHRTDRDEVKMAEKLDIEVLLSPVSGSDLLLPYRVTIPTPLGSAVIQSAGVTATGALNVKAAALAE